MKEFDIKGAFICDFCRNICEGNCYELLTNIINGTYKEGSEKYEKNKDLIGRKNIITCLGPYCDNPCKYQRKEYTPYDEKDGIKPLVTAIKYLGNKCNELIAEKYTALNNNKKK